MTKNEKSKQDAIYYQLNKEKIKAQRRERYKKNKEKELENSKKYYLNHLDEIKDYQQSYREENKDSLKAYKDDYYRSMHGRAKRLVNHYRREDLKHNRGECTLTAQWIADNIFSKLCHYCGETDWTKIGCDRIDNSKPHTPDNVVPCCFDCNKKRGTKSYEEFLKENGIVVADIEEIKYTH